MDASKTGSRNKTLVQLLKYGVIGVGNTLLSLLVIYIAQEWQGLSPTLSNVLGYTVGLINSFIWNSKWTFNSKMTYKRFTLFSLMFIICYFSQLAVLWLLNSADNWITVVEHYYSKPLFLNQIIAMAVYTLMNFFLNKFITYRGQ